MDEELISNPTVNAKITGGKAEITGMASQEEAQERFRFQWRRLITIQSARHLEIRR